MYALKNKINLIDTHTHTQSTVAQTASIQSEEFGQRDLSMKLSPQPSYRIFLPLWKVPLGFIQALLITVVISNDIDFFFPTLKLHINGMSW